MVGERRGGGPRSREADSVSCLYISMGAHGWRTDEGRLPSQYGGSPPLRHCRAERRWHIVSESVTAAHTMLALARTGTISTYA